MASAQLIAASSQAVQIASRIRVRREELVGGVSRRDLHCRIERPIGDDLDVGIADQHGVQRHGAHRPGFIFGQGDRRDLAFAAQALAQVFACQEPHAEAVLYRHRGHCHAGHVAVDEEHRHARRHCGLNGLGNAGGIGGKNEQRVDLGGHKCGDLVGLLFNVVVTRRDGQMTSEFGDGVLVAVDDVLIRLQPLEWHGKSELVVFRILRRCGPRQPQD